MFIYTYSSESTDSFESSASKSALSDSYMYDITGAPCYTRPEEYQRIKVPSELVSGDHKKIKKIKRELALKKCQINRPDLLEKTELTIDEQKMLNFS